MDGFIYLLSAGSGFPLKEGLISGAYRVENIDLVRKSSAGKEGAVKFENALAAERSLDRDNEMLDFKLDFGLVIGDGRLTGLAGTNAIAVVILLGRAGASRSGCDETDTTAGEDTFRSFLLGLRSDGVRGYEKDEESDGPSVSRDGVERIDSEDIEREGTIGSSSTSSTSGMPESESSSNNKSNGEPFDTEGDRNPFFHSSRNRSIDTLRGRDRANDLRAGGGMAVLANKAATEAGTVLVSGLGLEASFFVGDMALFLLGGIETG